MKTLKIDCDWVPPADWIRAYIDVVIPRVLGDIFKKVIIKKSKHHRLHFRILLKEHVDDEEVCRLQFLLGDDRHRCMYNYARVVAGMRNGEWNKLFQRSSYRRVVLSNLQRRRSR